MNVRSLRAVITVALATILTTTAALAQAPASPSPSPTSAPSDPCGSILSIVTRPSVTTAVCTVRDGHVDVENGYTNATITGAGGGTAINYPQSFVRLGIGQHMEIAFAPPSYNRSSLGGSIVSGSSDMNFGAKWELGYNSKALWGANLQVSAPTGDSSFTAGGAQYTGNLNWSYAFNSIFGAAGTFGFNSLFGASSTGQTQQFSAFTPSVEFTAALPGGPSQLFAECAYSSHAGPGLGGRTLLDFGYQKDVGEHVQLDVEYGFQTTIINGQKLHYFGAGLSFMN